MQEDNVHHVDPSLDLKQRMENTDRGMSDSQLQWQDLLFCINQHPYNQHFYNDLFPQSAKVRGFLL